MVNGRDEMIAAVWRSVDGRTRRLGGCIVSRHRSCRWIHHIDDTPCMNVRLTRQFQQRLQLTKFLELSIACRHGFVHQLFVLIRGLTHNAFQIGRRPNICRHHKLPNVGTEFILVEVFRKQRILVQMRRLLERFGVGRIVRATNKLVGEQVKVECS